MSRDPPPEIGKKFEIIDLDFCGPVGPDMQHIIKRCCLTMLDRSRGVLIVTFSYGRDVAEFFLAEARDGHISGGASAKARYLMDKGCPETVAGRVIYLASKMGGMTLRSLCLYQGNRMPMCSTLWEAFQVNNPQGWAGEDLSVTKMTTEDLPEAVLMPDPGLLYAVPAERILAMRRSAAARRAVATKQAKEKPRPGSTRHPEDPEIVHAVISSHVIDADGLVAVYCGIRVPINSGEWRAPHLDEQLTCVRCYETLERLLPRQVLLGLPSEAGSSSRDEEVHASREDQAGDPPLWPAPQSDGRGEDR